VTRQGARGIAATLVDPVLPNASLRLGAASNLVLGDANGMLDGFVRDRSSGRTEWASVTSRGRQTNGSSSSPAITGDGRFVTFDSAAANLVPGDGNGAPDVFVHIG
jgi:hypothetical protein